MMAAVFSRNAPIDAQSKREIAQIVVASPLGCYDSEKPCDLLDAGDGSSKPLSAFCQHRYPSPCRFAFTQSRPASPFWGGFPDLATNRYMLLMLLELAQENVNVSTRSTNKEGNSSCSRKHTSSRQSRSLALQAALNLMRNARLLALALVSSLQKRQAQTQQLVHSVAQSLARCVTTSASAKTSQRKLTEFERRRGLSAAAFSV